MTLQISDDEPIHEQRVEDQAVQGLFSDQACESTPSARFDGPLLPQSEYINLLDTPFFVDHD
jgi:hypothetical protein